MNNINTYVNRIAELLAHFLIGLKYRSDTFNLLLTYWHRIQAFTDTTLLLLLLHFVR